MKSKTEQIPIDIAIIGMDCYFPMAQHLRGYTRLLLNEEDAITDIPSSHWQIDDYYDPDPHRPDHVYAKKGGFISPILFDPTEFGIPPNLLEATDTAQILALSAAHHALTKAGYGKENQTFNRDRTSVILGVTGTQELVVSLSSRLAHPKWRKAMKAAGISQDQIEIAIENISNSFLPWQENSFPGLLGNVVAGRICNRLDLRGTNCTIDAACASSFSAIYTAILELLNDKADMVVTGGVDALNDIFMHMCFSKTHVLSSTGDLRPFSKDADGTLLGEGIGIILLKKLDLAKQDNDPIYAVIKGIGTSSDGRSQSIYAPSKEGQAKALQKAYKQANISPSTIGIIEAHGTGTRVGDAVEFSALRTTYEKTNTPLHRTAIGSVKSMIGHTKAAAGVAGLIKIVLSLHHKILFPTLKATSPAPELNIDQSPFYLSLKSRPWFQEKNTPRRAAVSAFGFGGCNYHIVLEEYQSKKTETVWCGISEIFSFSGSSNKDLLSKLQTMTQDLANADLNAIRRFATETRTYFSATDPVRLLLHIPSQEGNISISAAVSEAETLLNAPEASFLSGRYACVGRGTTPKIAFLFPGQGSQYLQMGKDLANTFPQMFSSIKAFTKDQPELAIAEKIYPFTTTNKQTLTHQLEELTQTNIAQPAIGAISLGMIRLLTEFGISPTACCGHSFGELTALFAAGWIDLSTFITLTFSRAQSMNEAARQKTQQGTMTAVRTPLADTEEMLKEFPSLTLANRNSFTQGIVSGEKEEIARFEKQLQSQNIPFKRLSVATAFHSSFVEKASQNFGKEVKKASIVPTNTPVYANTTGILYPTELAEIKSILSHQLTNPVDFVTNIQSMANDGISLFVEVGPKSVLTQLVKDILPDSTIHAISIDASNGKQNGLLDFGSMLCHLAALGTPVLLTNWEDSIIPNTQYRMKINVSGANPTPQPAFKTCSPSSLPLKENNMDKKTPPALLSIPEEKTLSPEAYQVLETGLKALQQIQEQTAQAHLKFLETQTFASQTVEEIMARSGSASIFSSESFSQFQPTIQPEKYPTTVPSEKEEKVVASTTPIITEKTTTQPADEKKLKEKILQVTAQLTGYPAEMLSLDMHIEADLGIDSIKRVEILSALQESISDLPPVSPDDLASLNTLGEIVSHFTQHSKAPQKISDDNSEMTFPASSNTPLTQELLRITATLTGYPEEMLSLDMNIESDLGIDSIKRVEILSALQESMPSLPSLSPDDLASLNTLGEIIHHFTTLTSSAPSANFEKVNSSNIVDLAEASTPSTSSSFIQADLIKATLLDGINAFSNYPADMISLNMNLQKDFDLSLEKQKELLSLLIEAMPELPKIEISTLLSLPTLGDIIQAFSPHQKEIQTNTDIERYSIHLIEDIPTPERTLFPNNEKVFHIVYHEIELANLLKSALEKEGFLVETFSSTESFTFKNSAGLLLLASKTKTTLAELKQGVEIAKQFYNSLPSKTKHPPVFATVSFLDGTFGFSNVSLQNPLSGGYAGLSKTAKQEWPNVICRAIDVGSNFSNTEELIASLVAEILSSTQQNSPVEIGLQKNRRIIPILEKTSFPQAVSVLSNKDVFLFTGGARGITATCAIRLAKEIPATFILFGRSQRIKEPSWLHNITQPVQIKSLISEHLQKELSTPIKLEEFYQQILASREISKTLQEIQQTGATAIYLSTDVSNAAELQNAINEIRNKYGSITGIVHGAGVLRDKKIAQKTTEMIDAVFSPKIDGLRSLLEATQNDPLRYLLLFSSVSARFGNQGQADYAMANEVLNKLAHQISLRIPSCRVASLNWGPWESGMVTPSLKKKFEQAGTKLIPLQSGANAFLRELLASPDSSVEVVLGDSLPTSLQSKIAPKKETSFNSMGHPVLCRTISVKDVPILNHHRLAGTPVVPFALLMDWSAHIALTAHPGLRIYKLSDVRLFKGIRLQSEAIQIKAYASSLKTDNSLYWATTTFTSDDTKQLYITAQAGLGDPLFISAEKIHTPITSLVPYPLSIADAYDQILFHTADLQSICKIRGISETSISACVKTTPLPTKWVLEPFTQHWATDPLSLDSAFQLAILWAVEKTGKACLPSYIKEYSQYVSSFDIEEIMIDMKISSVSEHKLISDFYFYHPTQNTLLAEIKGYEAILDDTLCGIFKSK